MRRSARSLLAGAGLGAVAALALAAAPAGAAKVQLASSAAWAADARVPEKVRAQCALETGIPKAIAAASTDVELVSGKVNRAQGRALEITIHDVHAPGGGVFSGPKWGNVTGELYENGKLIGSFRARRSTMGGAWGMFMGSCSILDRVSKALGQDIATFLTAPRLDAALGEAR
jgi:hypothetical protein